MTMAALLSSGTGLANAGSPWQAIDDLCCEALKREADAWPKPGLVSPVDSGSHRDMSYATFIDSIASLRGYFSEIAYMGAQGASYAQLQRIAVAAEARMLTATRGINTHRGAVFNLGLLAAATGARLSQPALGNLSCGRIVAAYWGEAILASRKEAPVSHGNRVWQHCGFGGAREEAAAGFPSIYEIGVPVLHLLMERGVSEEEALIGTLMAIMAELPDTNLLWRGGATALRDVRTAASTFNASGGVLKQGWRTHLQNMHQWMVRRNLSPGGSADLAAASWLAHRLETFRERS